ncbi:putative exosome complex component RRP43 [Paratrimastix pyriformis]|uniref:Ribosomal RNA-processing protein 43 n=1 Tax=Paratrimastix pyriformis TaxID=342808 RepID=A0ABQ8UUM0_9EUKA|nr:putative exosome complex component RRP43 [Paratrimastix pyriformis]
MASASAVPPPPAPGAVSGWDALSPEQQKQLSFSRHFLEQIQKTGKRPNGRLPSQFTSVALSTGTFPSPGVYGSSIVSIGGTSAICCVMGSVVRAPLDEPATKGALDAEVQLHPIACAQFQGEMGSEAKAVGAFLVRQFSRALRCEELVVCEGRAAWHLTLSCMAIAHDGSLHEALVLACLAALSTLSLPEVTATRAAGIYALTRGSEWTLTYSKELRPRGNLLRHYPLALSVAHIQSHFLMEPTADEEEMVSGTGGGAGPGAATGGLLTLLIEGPTGALIGLEKAPGAPLALPAVLNPGSPAGAALLAPAATRAVALWRLVVEQMAPQQQARFATPPAPAPAAAPVAPTPP